MTYVSSQNSSLLRTLQALLYFLADTILSSIWLIHLILHNIFHAHNFLDVTLTALHHFFPPFEVALYVTLYIYILLCITHCNNLFCQFLHSSAILFNSFELFEVYDAGIEMLIVTAILWTFASHGLMHSAVRNFPQYTVSTIIK